MDTIDKVTTIEMLTYKENYPCDLNHDQPQDGRDQEEDGEAGE